MSAQLTTQPDETKPMMKWWWNCANHTQRPQSLSLGLGPRGSIYWISQFNEDEISETRWSNGSYRARGSTGPSRSWGRRGRCSGARTRSAEARASWGRQPPEVAGLPRQPVLLLESPDEVLRHKISNFYSGGKSSSDTGFTKLSCFVLKTKKTWNNF